QSLEHRPLSGSQLFPEPFEVLGLTTNQVINNPVDIVDIQFRFVLQFGIVPQLVRNTLHVIRNEIGGADHAVERLFSYLPASVPELSLDEVLPGFDWNFLQENGGTRFVEGTSGGQHFLH